MPSAKSGKAGSIVAPSAPTAPHDADQADPVEVAKAKAREMNDPKSKYGWQQAQKRKAEPGQESDPIELTWIDVQLNDKDGNPVPGERFQIWTKDGEVIASGTLNDQGYCRVENVPKQTYKITFPAYDKRAWKPA